MKPGDTEILTFKPEIEGDFIYIFNVIKTNDLSPKGPNIIISFNQGDYMHITKYGIYTKKNQKKLSFNKYRECWETNEYYLNLDMPLIKPLLK